MNDWRCLTEEEKEILLSYYKRISKLPVIILTFVKCFTIFNIICGLFQAISYISTAPFFTVSSIFTCCITFGIFFIIPNKLLKPIKQKIEVLENDVAIICDAVVSDKKEIFTHRLKRHKKRLEYVIYANLNIDGEKIYCSVFTNYGSYKNIVVGDTCKILYFPSDNSLFMDEKNMVAFEKDFKYIIKENGV
jgi:hypothetical protein